MNRAERRYRKTRKWISRLKKYFYSGLHYYTEIGKPYTRFNSKNAKTYDELKNSIFGQMLKNTGTLYRVNKFWDIKEKRKMTLDNRKVSDDDLLEAEEELNINITN